MRKLMFSVLILCLLPDAYAADQSPDVKKLENGFYASDVLQDTSGTGTPGFPMHYIYIVDSTAGICCISRSTILNPVSTDLQVVPCKSLKKRHEWANIITWE